MKNNNNSRRLAKNTLLMYIRMGVLMLITLYTSRVVLQQLGVDDFGIYNLIGSVVLMFSSLRTAFASSTQRFLNYEMGVGNDINLNKVYNTSIQVNILIAIVFIVLVEIVGFWFFSYKINIAQDRILASQIVFQISIASAIISLFNTTFDAEVIAHEKMDFFAYMSIIEGFLKLAMVYLLGVFRIDKLILYGVLQLGVSVVVFSIHYLYCSFSFKECYLSIKIDKGFLKKMTQFTGWSFLGTNTLIIVQNGMNMLLNMFGGPIVNAARGIAFQINAVVTQFLQNVVVVINPYCVKTYASGNTRKAFGMICLSSKILFLIQLLLSIPLFYFTKNILELWLGVIPEYSIGFIQLILLYSLVRSVHPSIDIWFKASGNLKKYQIFECVLLIVPLIMSYFALRLGMDYYIVFLSMAVVECFNLIGILRIANLNGDFSNVYYFKSVIIHALALLLIAFSFFIICSFIESILVRIILCFIVELLSVIYMTTIGLSMEERTIFIHLIKNK